MNGTPDFPPVLDNAIARVVYVPRAWAEKTGYLCYNVIGPLELEHHRMAGVEVHEATPVNFRKYRKDPDFFPLMVTRPV